ncbi:MAG TPA: potassium channel protein [Candidatus Acidoferrales bacterium]|nr:potassium channel protein [Candidatus Acidoferrales bacterium]
MESVDPFRRFRVPVALVAGALAYGTLGYTLIEGWSPFDAFYMTLTTISTVGFGEIHQLSTAGRVFTSTLILGGTGAILYTFGVFAETVAEGRFGEYRRQRRMRRDIDQLRDHFIVCGYGRVGTQVVREFEDNGVAYVVVDNNPEPLARLRREDRSYIEGDAASEDVLHKAGITRAKGLLAVVDSDERVVYITLAARALNPKLYITARAGQPESARRLELAGANRVVSPYGMAGRLMAQHAIRPAVVDVIETMQHAGSDVGIEEILVSEECRVRGRTLRDAGLLEKGQARLLAIRRRDGTLHVNPDDDLRIEGGDLVIAMGSGADLGATAALLA